MVLPIVQTKDRGDRFSGVYELIDGFTRDFSAAVHRVDVRCILNAGFDSKISMMGLPFSTRGPEGQLVLNLRRDSSSTLSRRYRELISKCRRFFERYHFATISVPRAPIDLFWSKCIYSSPSGRISPEKTLRQRVRPVAVMIPERNLGWVQVGFSKVIVKGSLELGQAFSQHDNVAFCAGSNDII